MKVFCQWVNIFLRRRRQKNIEWVSKGTRSNGFRVWLEKRMAESWSEIQVETQGWIKSPSGFITSQTKTNKKCFTVWLQILSQKRQLSFLTFLRVPLVYTVSSFLPHYYFTLQTLPANVCHFLFTFFLTWRNFLFFLFGGHIKINEADF